MTDPSPATRAEDAFEALVQAACDDAEAAAGLLQAYVTMAPEVRGSLLDLLLARDDLARLGPLLALLSTGESSPALALRLMAVLPSVEPRSWALSWGDRAQGGAAVARGDGFGPCRGLSLRWSGGELHTESRTDLWASGPEDVRTAFGVPDDAILADPEWVLDEVAIRLWDARRAGRPWPRALVDAAALFDRVA